MAPTSPWKGKERATEEDFETLNPRITYRHILSYNLGVRDPLRVVALCDSDAFYAACEMVRLGIDKDRPLVVLQWDSLIAVNYPARKFGISRMDKLNVAKKRCPELVVVHVATYKEGEKEPGYWDDIDSHTHKVSLDHYRRESMKILNMFKEGLPGAEIEKASIDEAFIDFTRPVRAKILERYPYLSTLPVDAPDGIDTELPAPPPISWDGCGAVVPVLPPSPDSASETNKNEIGVGDDTITTWHDVALLIAAEMMSRIRTEVYEKLGYSTSAGIARNKFLAKLTASYKKPMNQTILRNAAIPNYLRPMPFQKIRFLGGKLGDALAKEYDVSTVGDLLSISLEELQHKFGENAIWVYELLRGIDRSEVKEKSVLFKSMLASKNLQQPIRTASEGYHWIRVLAAELALRLNDARKISPTLWPKSIVLHARQGYETSRSRQAAFHFTREVTVDVIASAGDRLWKELVGNTDTKAVPMKITNVQLAFTGLETADQGQQSIEGFLKADTRDPRAEKRTRRGDDDDRDGAGTTSILGADSSTDQNLSQMSFFVCMRCTKRISLPETWTDGDGGDDAQVAAMAAMKMEHDDFHFAQDLARTPETDGEKRRKPESSSKRIKKTREDRKGIARFFK